MPAMTIGRTGALVLFLANAIGCRSEADRFRLAGTLAAEGMEASRTPRAEGDPAEGTAVDPRRLWAGGGSNFYASSPSPDGRYVTEIDWTTGDLAVRDLTDGRLHRLTDKGGWTASGDYALASAFSPDGREVAYVWWHGAVQRHQLRKVGFTIDESGTPRGLEPRVISNGGPSSILGWSADGWILATLRRLDRTVALALVSAETGETRVLESFDWREPRGARSPDGGTIAYDFPSSADTPERDIHLLSVDGTRKVAAVRGPADDRVVGWLPDGSGLLYVSREKDRPDANRVYRLPIRQGKPAGPAEPVRDDLPARVEPLGVAAGAFYFGVTVESPELRVGMLDRKAGRLTTTESFPDPYGGAVRAWDWSPDGSHLVHDARGRPGSLDFRIVVRAPGGEPLRDFHLDGRADVVRWAPDGQTVLLYAWDRANRPGFRALDLESGQLRTIRNFSFEWQAMGGEFALSPDGHQLYYRLLDPGAEVSIPTTGSILRRDLESGVEETVRGVHSGGSLAVSPDGERLAFVDFDTVGGQFVLSTMPVAGGPATDVFRQMPGKTINSLNWTPDGTAFVFLSGSPANSTLELLEVPATGGPPRRIEEVEGLTSVELRLHPDGRSLAFRAGHVRSEIWALDVRLPTAKRSEASRERRP